MIIQGRLMSTRKECHRKACDFPLDRGCWRVYNEPSVVDGHNDYCAACGRMIVEYSKGTDFEFKYEAIRGDKVLHGTKE